jgi:hypothetical protein
LVKVDGCAGYWVKHDEQMNNNYRGLKWVTANFQMLNIYIRILGALAANGDLNQRRRRAACNVLWPLAHLIADTDINEACEIYEWIIRLDPTFHLGQRGSLARLYRIVGFRATENLLKVRRAILSVVRERKRQSVHNLTNVS